MRSVNKVILIGNLTRDPEMRQTQSNQPVTTFSIATNRVWVTKDGSQQSSTEYHDLVAWSRLAEICHKYLKKSKLVYVEGYLKTRSWDSPEGIRKFKTEVVVQDMIMLEKRPRGDDHEEEILPMANEEIASFEEPIGVNTEIGEPEENSSVTKNTSRQSDLIANDFSAPVKEEKLIAEKISDESSIF